MDFKDFESIEVNGGIQYLHFFPNGFGVSIVKHSFSHGSKQGLWEMAVLIGNEEDYDITYDTYITNDVIGYLNEEQVNGFVEQVSKLPKQILRESQQ